MMTVRLHNGAAAALVFGALGLTMAACTPATGVAIMSSSAGAATGAGIERTMGGKAHKTFVEPLADVEAAARDTLGRMALTLEEAEDRDDGRKLKARAEKRRIEIDIERLTPLATRITVVAKRNNVLFPDEATATEIILQIAKALEDGPKGVGSAVPDSDSLAGRQPMQ